MRKKEYIEKATNVILNRIKFHAPVVFDSSIDKTILFERGVDPKLPVFKFDKTLNNNLLTAFENASRQQKFNLVLSEDSFTKKQEKKIKKLPRCVIYSPNFVNLSFLEMINKLNINYASASNYNLEFSNKFIKVNGEILNPYYKEFALCQDKVIDSLEVSYREFVLNGNNYYIKVKNCNFLEKKIQININLPLEKGYYYFKKQDKCIKIENLLSKKVQYFNFVCSRASFRFSEVDGLENSRYSCINLKVSISARAHEENVFFFNLSEGKMPVKTKSGFEKLYALSVSKCCEIFNLRVKTKNPSFDQFFNNTLPKKIWLKWNSGECDEKLEQKYITLRRLFIKGKEKVDFVPFKEIGLQTLGIYNGEYYKKILVSFGAETYLQVGKTKFYNINGVTKESLTKKEPILLSFEKELS